MQKFKWRNGDVVFWIYIILFVMTAIFWSEVGKYIFVTGALILLLLKATLLRSWWDIPLKKK